MEKGLLTRLRVTRARSGLLVAAMTGALLLAACDNEPNEARGEPPPPPAVTVAHPVVKKNR